MSQLGSVSSEESGAPEGTAPPDEARVWSRRANRLFDLVTVAVIAPIWVAVVRVGLRGLIPIGDTAIMALRAPDVLSRHPPLVGMPASGASTAASVVHFPGPLQLWWLAGPVKILGPTWGTVVAMGMLSTIWTLLAAHLLRRNLQPIPAFVALAVLSAFYWAIGNGMLIDAWPLKMVVAPTILLVIAAWNAAAGDGRALVVLAIVTNYLWLDHLVLVVLAPIVALAGLIGYVVGLVAANRRDPLFRKERNVRARRSMLIAGSVSLVMWVPTLIDQVTNAPGNLRALLQASSERSGSIESGSAALHVVAGLLSRPPFWLRDTLADPSYYRRHFDGFAVGSATWFDLVTIAMWVALLVTMTIFAARRHDRTTLAMSVICLVTLGATFTTVYSAPATAAVVTTYFFSFWAIAAFAWMTLITAAVRLLPTMAHRSALPTIVAIALFFTAMNVPMSPTGYTESTRDIEVTKAMAARVLPELVGHERVGVGLANPLASDASHMTGMLVAMQRQGIEFCFPAPNQSLYEFIPTCDGSESRTVLFADVPEAERPRGKVLFEAPLSDRIETPTMRRLDDRVRAWLDKGPTLRLTDAARRPFLTPILGDWLQQRATLAARGSPDTDLADASTLWDVIIKWYELSDNRGVPLFEDCPISSDDLYRWAVDRRDLDTKIWIIEVASAS